MSSHPDPVDPISTLGSQDTCRGESLHMEAFGVHLDVRTNRPSLMRKLIPHLPYGWKRAPESDAVAARFSVQADPQPGSSDVIYRLFRDSGEVASSLDPDYIARLLGHTLIVCLTETSSRRVFLHAGAVGWRGRGLLLPGPGWSGKSSLVAELVRAGADYYTDDVAVLDRQGRVHFFGNPLRLRDPDSSGKTEYPAESLGGDNGGDPLPVTTILLTRHQPEVRFRPTVLSRGRGILALLAHAQGVRAHPEQVLDMLQGLGSDVLFLEGPRPEARLVVDELLERVG